MCLVFWQQSENLYYASLLCSSERLWQCITPKTDFCNWCTIFIEKANVYLFNRIKRINIGNHHWHRQHRHWPDLYNLSGTRSAVEMQYSAFCNKAPVADQTKLTDVCCLIVCNNLDVIIFHLMALPNTLCICFRVIFSCVDCHDSSPPSRNRHSTQRTKLMSFTTRRLQYV